MNERDEENLDPNQRPKRRRLSLSLKNKVDRFADVTQETLEDMSLYKMPKNSSQNCKWAMKNFVEWLESYNSRNPDKPCPSDVLSPSCGKDVLNEWLCVYVNETRNQKGERYSPKTLYALLCGILRHMRVSNPRYPNFLEGNDPDFVRFRNTLDNLFKVLRTTGIGSSSSHTEDISKDDERQLWSCGVLNIDSPKGLLRAVFFYCGKCFCLRGGQEHRELSLSQLERLEHPDRYIYRENSSKNKQGGIRQIHVEHKVVTIVANSAVMEKCPVFLLDRYISKLPKEAKENDIFYCRPLQKIPQDSTQPWYSPSPVGRNMLQTMVREMCEEAGISGRKTNHSLRVSGTTSLFSAGVPERVIQGRSGHSSLEALRKYERVSGAQEMAVSRILSGETYEYEPSTPEDIVSNLPKVPVVSSTSVSTVTTSTTPVMYKDCTFNTYSGIPPTVSPFFPPGYPNYGQFPMPPFGTSPYQPYLPSVYQPPPLKDDLEFSV